MTKRKLGNTPIEVFSLGLGCMGMSEFYGATNEAESIQTMHKAVEQGVNFFDTADMYGDGANEILVGKALKPFRNQITIATKFGIVRNPEDPIARLICGRPAYVKKACEASLKRLDMDVIDLYYLHRVDVTVPIEETIGAMSELVKEGKVKYLGLSEVNPATLKKAHSIHPITALQTEYSLWSREPERELLALCEQLNISFVAYSPLGRGFLSGKIKSVEELEIGDFRKNLPRFKDGNITHNQALVDVVNEMAEKKGCTSAQLALAWLLAKSKKVIPIPGTKKINYMLENIKAAELILSHDETEELGRVFSQQAIVGNRYPELGMSLVDL